MDERRVSDESAVAVVERPSESQELAAADAPGGGPRDAAEGGAVSIIRPVASPEEVLAAWQQFQDLKRSLLTLDDYQDIQGRPRIKKSGWRKIAAAFGISDQILREERRELDLPGQGGRQFVWEITVRAIAPNGRYADAVGSCASNERRFSHVDHDVRATAHTRGKNRAIADLVGGGEVSAEELEGELLERRMQAAEQAGSQPTEEQRSPAVRAPERAPAWDDGATAAQLRAIRAHLRRTGIDEARACARAGVASLEALTRRSAAELLTALSRQPNAA